MSDRLSGEVAVVTDDAPLALYLATLPPTGPTGQIFSLMRRNP